MTVKNQIENFTINGVSYNYVNEIDSDVFGAVSSILEKVGMCKDSHISKLQKHEDVEVEIINTDELIGMFSREFQYISKGACGVVYDLGKYVAKINTSEFMGLKSRDGEMLHRLEGLPFIPEIYLYDEFNRIMIIQKIDGYNLIDNKNHKKNNRHNIPLLTTKEQIDNSIEIYKNGLLERGVSEQDLHSENAMIDVYGDLWIVDLGLFIYIEEEYTRRLSPESIYSSVRFLVDIYL